MFSETDARHTFVNVVENDIEIFVAGQEEFDGVELIFRVRRDRKRNVTTDVCVCVCVLYLKCKIALKINGNFQKFQR